MLAALGVDRRQLVQTELRPFYIHTVEDHPHIAMASGQDVEADPLKVRLELSTPIPRDTDSPHT